MARGDQHISPGGLQRALEHPGQQKAVDIAVSDADVMGGLGLWLVLHEPHAALLTAVGPAADAGGLPVSVRSFGMTVALAVLSERSFAALVRSVPAVAGEPTAAIQQFGAAAAEPATRLLAQLHDWDDHGPTRTDELTIRAYPRPITRSAPPAAALIQLPHTLLTLDWTRRPEH